MKNLQHLCKHGNSVAVTIPRTFLFHLDWLCGRAIIVEVLDNREGVIVRLPRQDDFGPVLSPSAKEALSQAGR